MPYFGTPLAVISPAIASGTSIAVPLALSMVLVICFDWLAYSPAWVGVSIRAGTPLAAARSARAASLGSSEASTARDQPAADVHWDASVLGELDHGPVARDAHPRLEAAGL